MFFVKYFTIKQMEHYGSSFSGCSWSPKTISERIVLEWWIEGTKKEEERFLESQLLSHVRIAKNCVFI